MSWDDMTDPEEAERLSSLHADQLAQNRSWLSEQPAEPAGDLELLFAKLRGRQVLDAGCGWLPYGYQFFDRGLIYTGIDHSPGMLEAAAETYPNADLREMSVRRLQFPSSSFDGIWCCCVLEYLPKFVISAVLAEFRRVLVPGGILMIVSALREKSTEGMVCEDGVPQYWLADYRPTEWPQLLRAARLTPAEPIIRTALGTVSILAEKQ